MANCQRFLAGAYLDTRVKIDSMCTIFGVRFTGGHHHLTETIKRYQDDPHVDCRDTLLWSFLKEFHPNSTQDALGLRSSEEPLQLFSYPWGDLGKSELGQSKQALHSRFCGPSTDQFVREEFDRTIKLFQQVRELGYRPYRYPHSFVGGFWLKSNDGQKVFVVLQGNHRVSALACCGSVELDVRPVRTCPWTINEADVLDWPLVRSGLCSATDASEIFSAFFRDNGPFVADRLGRC